MERGGTLRQEYLGGLNGGRRGSGMQRARGHADGSRLHIHLELQQTADANLLSRGSQRARAQRGCAVDDVI